MIIGKALLVYMKPSSGEQRKSLDLIRKVLKSYKINFKSVVREKAAQKDFAGVDLVIVAGGDGTFLRAAQSVKDKTPVMGVNTDSIAKEGFFMRTNRKNFASKFEKLLCDKCKFLKLQRLGVSIDGKCIGRSLNEVYIGARGLYGLARYVLMVNGAKEEQKSSGVLIGTAAGSHAWIKSAGGKQLPLSSSRIQVIVREPYKGKLVKQKIKYKVLNRKQKVKVKYVKDNGVVVVDLLGREYKLKENSVVTVKASSKTADIYFIVYKV